MNLTADRKQLHEAARTTQKVTVVRKDNPAVSGILLQADSGTGEIRMTGSDMVTFIQKRIHGMHVTESGAAIIRADLLTDILRLLSGDTVSIETERHIAHIRAGVSHFQIPTLNAEKYPPVNIPFPEDTILLRGLTRLVRNTVYATSNNSEKSIMQGVRLRFSGDNTSASATDGIRMVKAESPHCSDGTLEMTLHKSSLNTLSSVIGVNEEVYAGIAGKSAVFFNKDIIFTTRLLEGDFFDFDRIGSAFVKQYGALADAETVYQAMGCVDTCLQPGDDMCINMLINQNEILFTAVSANGSSRAEAKVHHAVQTPADGFNYQPKEILEFLNRASGPLEIEINDRGFLLMKANHTSFIIAPRRPVKIKEKKAPKKAKSKKTEAVKTAA